MKNCLAVTTLCTIGLVFTVEASAQTAKLAPKPAPCVIRSISPTLPRVVKEGAAIDVAITTRNCAEVKSVMATAATDVEWNDVVIIPTRITAKVKAGPKALTGPTTIKLVLVDGTEVTSGNNVRLFVDDLQTVNERVDRLATTAERVARTVGVTNKIVDELRNDVEGTAARVEEVSEQTEKTAAQIEAAVKNRPTFEQTAELVVRGREPLQLQINEVLALVSALQSEAALRAKFEDEIVVIVASLANTEVRKSFFGSKKPHNMEAAVAAERLRQNLQALRQALNSTRTGGTGQQ